MVCSHVVSSMHLLQWYTGLPLCWVYDWATLSMPRLWWNYGYPSWIWEWVRLSRIPFYCIWRTI